MHIVFILAAVAPKVSVVEPSEKGRVVVTEGTGLKLKCRFTGAPTPRVVWLKDGLPLRPDFRLRVKDKRYKNFLCSQNISNTYILF